MDKVHKTVMPDAERSLLALADSPTGTTEGREVMCITETCNGDQIAAAWGVYLLSIAGLTIYSLFSVIA